MTNGDRPPEIFKHDSAPADVPLLGTLIIRTWYEPDQASGFRARITHSQKPGEEPTSTSTADPAEVLNVVQQWLATRPGVPPED